MTYTEDREVFERDLFKPPYLARMLERSGRYVGALDKCDRDLILQLALDNFWEMRDQINDTNGVLRVWDQALSRAARTRPRWKTWWSLIETRWVKGIHLGKNA